MHPQGFFEGRGTAQRLDAGLLLSLLLHAAAVYTLLVFPVETVTLPALIGTPHAIEVEFVAPAPEVKTPPASRVLTPEPVERKALAPVIHEAAPKKAAKLENSPSKPNKAKALPERLNALEPASAALASATHAQGSPAISGSSGPAASSGAVPVVREAGLKGRRVQPEYPSRALRLRQEGVVLLHVLVSEDGSQQSVKIVRPSGYDLLDNAALKAVQKWRFEPTQRNGQAIKSWIEIPIEFKIR